MAVRSSSFRQTALAAAVFAAFILLSSVPISHAFVSNNIIHQSSYSTKQTTSTSINIFGGLKDAFGNDDSLGKAKDAGLSNGPKYNDQVTVNGKPVKNAVVDQKISQVCAAARVKVSYNCQNGECGTCEMKVNGRKVRACVGKVPAGKCAITTN